MTLFDRLSDWPTWWPFAALALWSVLGPVFGWLLCSLVFEPVIDWLDRRFPRLIPWWDWLADVCNGLLTVIHGPLCWIYLIGHRRRLWLLLASALPLALSSCSTATALRCSGSGPRVILKVDVSAGAARMIGEPKPVDVITGRNGIGGRPGSGCTPIGTFKVAGKYRNTPKGLGKSLHLAGRDENGREQYDREIMCHADGWENDRGNWISRKGTHGCVCLPPSRMLALWERARVGDKVEISR